MLKRFAFGVAAIGIAVSMSPTADATKLTPPNGAASLREQYSDWTVVCVIAADGDKKMKKPCSMQQEQARRVKNGPSQRVLAVELQPKDKSLAGVLVLPLGLTLDKGATLKIDDGKAADNKSFRTCVLAGCTVDIKADDKMSAALGKGKALSVKTMSNEGKSADFSISLNGFQNAFSRVNELMK